MKWARIWGKKKQKIDFFFSQSRHVSFLIKKQPVGGNRYSARAHGKQDGRCQSIFHLELFLRKQDII
jgi:hypothetical protein